MAILEYEGKRIDSKGDETILKALQRHGEDVNFSCGKGTCQVCLMKCSSGAIDPKGQEGLREELVQKGYFKPCTSSAEQEMVIESPNKKDFFSKALVIEKKMLTQDVCQLKLITEESFDYNSGQYINVKPINSDHIRSYSMASVPLVDMHLEIHVRRVEGGKISNWMIDELQVGESLEIQSALGDCYYQTEHAIQNMLMISTGTGLAPLYGIVRDALELKGHKGQIYLYQGVRHNSDLYFEKELTALMDQYSNFQYFQCVSGEMNAQEGDIQKGRATTIAFERHKELANWKVYLCGLPAMVADARDLALSFGADSNHIHADAFENYHNQAQGIEVQESEHFRLNDDVSDYPEKNLKLWQALGNGERLTEILTEFYRVVFSDARLSPFFSHVTEQRLIEKQYNFLFEALTGEQVYFGATLRNAHHWMVISDELFDYRSSILETVIRKFDLDEELIQQWHGIEEASRAKMVKARPWDKIIDGEPVVLDKFEEAIMDTAAICDTCYEEILPGEKIRYHLRLGKIFCRTCASLG